MYAVYQVKGALFRYLDARYGWSMDCLLDPEYDAKIAKGELPATNEPPEYVKYVRTVSKCYGDALVRQIRHIRRGQRHKGHKATRSIRRQGTQLIGPAFLCRVHAAQTRVVLTVVDRVWGRVDFETAEGN